jgi:uncharacterized membrane protein YeaQ/YmgE (transglycosylase-associated protein family)
MEIIGVIIAGAIIGALAKLVMPGKQAGGIIITIVLGIIGVIIGYYLAAALGVEATNGIDWLRWIISIIVAVVLIAIYGAVTGRRTPAVSRTLPHARGARSTTDRALRRVAAGVRRRGRGDPSGGCARR